MFAVLEASGVGHQAHVEAGGHLHVDGEAPRPKDLVEDGGRRRRCGIEEIEIRITRIVLMVVDGDQGDALAEQLTASTRERRTVEHVDGRLRADRCGIAPRTTSCNRGRNWYSAGKGASPGM